MNYLEIPLQAVPSQTVGVSLNKQKCSITLRELNNRQYLSLSINGVSICNNVLLQSSSRIVSASYAGLIGDFLVIDLNGNDAPIYTGWNTRWVLMYYYE